MASMAADASDLSLPPEQEKQLQAVIDSLRSQAADVTITATTALAEVEAPLATSKAGLRLLKGVAGMRLPPLLTECVARYTKIPGLSRNPFLWLWLLIGTRLMEMRSVAPEHRVAATTAKMLFNLLNVVMDDIGDELHDIELLHAMEAEWFAPRPRPRTAGTAAHTAAGPAAGSGAERAAELTGGASAGGDADADADASGGAGPAKRAREDASGPAGSEGAAAGGTATTATAATAAGTAATATAAAALDFCRFLRRKVDEVLATLPRFVVTAGTGAALGKGLHATMLQEALEFDLRQMMNEKRYSAMVNKAPALMNRTEHSCFAPHTMHAMIFLTVDLMASPSVDLQEIGRLRAAYWHANVMANISNASATWPREVPKRDWSCPLFPLGVEVGVFTPAELSSMPVDDIKARVISSGIQERLFEAWRERYLATAEIGRLVKSFDVTGDFCLQNVAFLVLHLACKGHI